MTDQNDIHFADDEDLLGRYVLGSLPEDERARLDIHVATCQACARAVHQERLLAAGIKRQGRDELKQALRARLAASKTGVPWPKILAAAALVAILGGAGVYYRYFSAVPSIPEIVERSPAHAREAEPSIASEPSGAPVSDEAQHPAAPISRATLDAKAKQDKLAPLALTETMTKKESSSEISRADTLSGRNAFQGRLNEKASEAFWAEGSVEGPEQELAGALNQAVSGNTQGELSKRAVAAPQAASGKDNTVRDQELQQYVLKQAPSNALPPVRQKSLQAARQTTVQTRVERRGEVTTLTLFLDSLLDEQALKNARVQALADDSVVITLGQKKISYKFPPAIGAQTQTRK